MKNELQNIISGKNKISIGARIQKAACYLRESPETSKVAKDSKHYKAQETEILKKYITANNLWVYDIALENYVSEGAEQKVYLKNERTVSKLNDAIFFNSWEDYFNNLLLHNYFFPTNAYSLEGFYLEKDTLFLQ